MVQEKTSAEMVQLLGHQDAIHLLDTLVSMFDVTYKDDCLSGLKLLTHFDTIAEAFEYCYESILSRGATQQKAERFQYQIAECVIRAMEKEERGTSRASGSIRSGICRSKVLSSMASQVSKSTKGGMSSPRDDSAAASGSAKQTGSTAAASKDDAQAAGRHADADADTTTRKQAQLMIDQIGRTVNVSQVIAR